MTVTELKEQLQKLEDQGHGDKSVKYKDYLYNTYEEIDIAICDPFDTFVEVV